MILSRTKQNTQNLITVLDKVERRDKDAGLYGFYIIWSIVATLMVFGASLWVRHLSTIS